MNVPSFMFVGKRSIANFLLTCTFAFFLFSTSVAQNDKSFYLIAGSFNTLETAQLGMSKIESDYGRKPELLFPGTQTNSRNYRVSVYRASSRNEISAYQNSLKQKGMKPGWIFEMAKPVYPSPVMRGSVATQRLGEESYAKNGVETYYLITGSFKTFDQADQDRMAKIDQGFESEVLFPEATGSGTYKVSVFYTTSRKQIDSYAALLKRKGIDGWIYTAKAFGESRGSSATTAKVDKAASAIVIDAPASANTYHIVGGSFKEFDQASTFSETMKLKGINPHIIFPKTEGGYFRVSVFSSKNRAAVTERNSQLKEQGVLSKGWIYTQ